MHFSSRRISVLPAAVLIAPVGPLAVALIRGILPYSTTDDTTSIVTAVGADQGISEAVLWLTYLALLTLPLGVLVTGCAAMRARPVLGAIAAVVAWAGFVSLFGGVTGDAWALAGHRVGLSVTDIVRLGSAAESLAPAMVAAVVFVVGHILGGILLGVALWRAIPRWAAFALVVSQPLHLLFAVIVPHHWADAAAWSLTAVGFGAAALATLRAATSEPNGERGRPHLPA